MSRQYEVQFGDTLSQIAQLHNVSVSQIQELNPMIENPDQIQEGWKLDLPAENGDAHNPGNLPPSRSANDNTSTDASCTECQLEYVELVHITGEEGAVHALTERQCNDLISAVEELQLPLIGLQSAEGQSDERVAEAKTEAWQALKDLNALPPIASSTTVEELIAEYRARWQLAQERLHRQERRRERIRSELNQVRRDVLSPLHRRPSNESKDLLTVRIFRTLSNELEQTLSDIETVLDARSQEVSAERANYESLDERLQFLRAALEAEVAYRVAQASDSYDSDTMAQLAHESAVLRERTQWPEFIRDSEIGALVQRQQRLAEIEAAPAPAWWRETVHYLVTSDPTPSLWSLIDTREVDQYRELQREKKRLLVEQEAALSRIVGTSPPPSNDVFASPNVGDTRSWNVVEIKRTGEPGYRYITRESLQQFRQGWRPMTMADVKEAMSSSRFREASEQARDAVRASPELKLKLAQWKSKEDNFFNQLNIELFKEDISTEDGRFSAAAEAQMFRFASQAGLAASYNPAKKEAYIGGKVEGTYSLLEGKASLSAQLPDVNGRPLILKYQDQKGDLVPLHCGLFRVDAEYSIQGFAGACASLAANVRASSAPGNVGITGDANGEVFAGASLQNEAAFSVKWKAAYAAVQDRQSSGEDEQVSTQEQERRGKADEAFKSLLEVKPEISLSAGVGAGFDFKVGLSESNRLYLTLKGHLVLGPGGGGGVAAELNGPQVIELIKFVRWSLEQSDFRFLEWMDVRAFAMLSLIQRIQAVSGEDLIGVAAWPLDRLQDYWRSVQESYLESLEAASGLMSEGQVSNYTPETKAEVLYMFSVNASRAMRQNNEDLERLASAAFFVLGTIQSHREFMEVLRRMGRADNGKGGVVDLKSNYVDLVLRFLYRSSKSQETEEWLSGLYA
ncbi:LysM peptidoglycan-binding domain-containing protein [Marinobacter shengliensis]|uniref:LysM peptidoglycan-binding domain-containing protein n=1 Tax=Marinobacter shengliensis TaxID=1389223 RepID=UPI00257266EF|nr:LysM domain-containing protein [Marinobacter shengliensis]BEH13807.1 hypothetical protein MAALD49_11750 [Marinobacter shengliensis]